ncbi:8827_t:CDS:1, partial [Racocetra persica]
HIIDIQHDKWSGYKKPYNSKNLKDVLLLPEEDPSLTQIKEEIICELKDSIIKGSAKPKEPSLTRINETIQELKNHIIK